MTDPTTPRDAAPDWDVLARYFAGESPADEARAVSGWLTEHPADAALLQRMDEVVRAETAAATASAAAGIDVEGALRRVRERRAADQQTAAPPSADVLPFRAPTPRRDARPAWRSPW